MMKILQINSVYNKGSTGKIVYDIHSKLQKQGIESIVCYGRGEKIIKPNVFKTCGELYSKIKNVMSCFTGLMYGGCFFSTKKMISIIKKQNPDVVHLHCLNGYFVNIYRVITWLKENRIKTVLTLHAEFMHTANCGYALECEKWKTGCGKCPRLKTETKSLFLDRTHSSWLYMKRAFEGFDKLIVTSVSPWLMDRAKQSPILADKEHVVVLNGTDTDVFRPYDTNELRAKHGINDDEKIIFHATAGFSNDPNHIKGGFYVLELAERLLNEKIKIFVAGTYDLSIVPPDNVIFLGRISDQKLLAQYYSMADMTLLTSKKETFSMICAESLCCGTPIVGFKAGGPEQITIPEYSSFSEFADIESLQRETEIMLDQAYDRTTIAQVAKYKYSIDVMVNNYKTVYWRLIK